VSKEESGDSLSELGDEAPINHIGNDVSERLGTEPGLHNQSLSSYEQFKPMVRKPMSSKNRIHEP
jgi:hypothetical protein